MPTKLEYLLVSVIPVKPIYLYHGSSYLEGIDGVAFDGANISEEENAGEGRYGIMLEMSMVGTQLNEDQVDLVFVW